MTFTSNKNPTFWRDEDFDEDATLLCTLDLIFDNTTVFKPRNKSFRGKISAVEPASKLKNN